MKILVLRFSSIGDIVLTSPVVRCLKHQLNAEVHFAVKAQYRDLVAHSPYLDKVHELGEDLPDLIQRLKHENFDLVVDLHHNLRTARIKRRLGVEARSFPKLNIEKWLLVNLKKDRMPRVHIVDRYMSTVEFLGVKNDRKGLELFIPPEKRVDKNILPEQHRNGYVAFAIGGTYNTKRLPRHRMIELAQLIEGPIVVIGGKEDVEDGRAISSAIGRRCFDATGQFDILGSASLIEMSSSVVAHDSGAMHIGAAFQKNVVCVWGNTVPAFGMGPYLPQHPERAHNAEVLGLPCRPCSKLGYPRCPQGHFRCMEKHDLPAIAKLVKQPNVPDIG
jgi:ADP-heptose:LPS heptosyltransferase